MDHYHLLVKLFITSLLTTYVDGQCKPCIGNMWNESRYADIMYEESNEHIENPERGFMQYTLSSSSNPTPLTVQQLNNWREKNGITLVWRQWKLDTFVSSDISQDFIDHIHQDFNVIREAGFSAIVRFMYTDVQLDKAPYGDADKMWMTRHINQLHGVFHEHESLMITVQAGFIGTWGEWYYTTHFGDPNHLDWDDPDNFLGMTPENWQDRHDILNTLLANIPPNVTVAIRYPATKYHLLQDEIPTQESDMQNLNKKYRISHHNDCFLSSPNDVGTYVNRKKEYPYLQEDLLYSNIGGETCKKDKKKKRHACRNALVEMRELHYTYLNQAYNKKVLKQWKSQGCYENIHRDMGYRLVLRNASFPESVSSGGNFCFTIVIENVGYAAPVKNRDVEIVFREATSGQLYSGGVAGVDVRTWLPGTTITIHDGVTMSVSSGTYQVLLAIKPHSFYNLTGFSDYNILLANLYTPEYKVGLNNLLHTVEVLSSNEQEISVNVACSPVTDMPVQEESPYDRRFCGWGECGVQCNAFPITNPSFEDNNGWSVFGNSGFEYTTEVASDGMQSIRINDGGALQVIHFPQRTKQFVVEADSRNEGVTGDDSDEYSIYCDIKLVNGTWRYGKVASFKVGNSNWHKATLQVSTAKNIAESWCYAMFRGYGGGTAYFDNFKVKICDGV